MGSSYEVRSTRGVKATGQEIIIAVRRIMDPLHGYRQGKASRDQASLIKVMTGKGGDSPPWLVGTFGLPAARRLEPVTSVSAHETIGEASHVAAEPCSSYRHFGPLSLLADVTSIPHLTHSNLT